MAASNRALVWICLTAGLLGPVPAVGFNPEKLPPAVGSSSRQEDSSKVVVLDNDFLDRRFGRSRGPETSAKENANSVPSERSAFSFTPAPVLDAPAKPAGDVLPNRSLLTAISRGTSARRAAALRLAETGRTLLQHGQNRKAIYYFEKALSVDANPFIHYYLARAHFQVADFQGAMRFLEVAESGFYGQPEWLPELAALRNALYSSPPAPQATPQRKVAWSFNE